MVMGVVPGLVSTVFVCRTLSRFPPEVAPFQNFVGGHRSSKGNPVPVKPCRPSALDNFRTFPPNVRNELGLGSFIWISQACVGRKRAF